MPDIKHARYCGVQIGRYEGWSHPDQIQVRCVLRLVLTQYNRMNRNFDQIGGNPGPLPFPGFSPVSLQTMVKFASQSQVSARSVYAAPYVRAVS